MTKELAALIPLPPRLRLSLESANLLPVWKDLTGLRYTDQSAVEVTWFSKRPMSLYSTTQVSLDQSDHSGRCSKCIMSMSPHFMYMLDGNIYPSIHLSM